MDVDEPRAAQHLLDFRPAEEATEHPRQLEFAIRARREVGVPAFGRDGHERPSMK
jgi:hypothetical protein